ncbi:MAG: ATP-dependent Clp protease proteolytic subunit [Spirochaetaceae bacterium]|nr:ATP-dependent Clp protease proteolytic subunit [Spirochaetaceae bacterium]MBO7420931.1 ATP-dependent Clp protease proteolytic subunit [Spirochaetaceae bacterium]
MNKRFEILLSEKEDDEKKKQTDEKEAGADILSAKFLKTRQIILSGEINKELAEKIARQLLILEADSDEPIRLFIDSPGGDADAGYAIFDMIRFINAPVITIGMGLIASAASIVLLAAPKERRFGMPNSRYLIHQPMSGMQGVTTEIEIHAQELEKMRVKINEMIAAETGKSVDDVAKDTDRDYWLDAEEAKKYGLISKICKTRKDIE